VKRCLDLLVAGIALVLLSPLLLTIAFVLRCTIGSPVLFRHRRPGLKGKPFVMVKFRTMSDARDATGRLLPDEKRTTAFGNWLRRSSLDELPELWNVVRGEMSLVGPRPLLMSYLEHYTPEQQTRHDVLPGITGWAQIHGRNDLPFDDKIALDVWYVNNRSGWLDLRILWRTAAVVLRPKGIEMNQKCLPTSLAEIPMSDFPMQQGTRG
jgi:sugar transferase EpsL